MAECRKCSCCGMLKDLQNFHKNGYYCKPCSSNYRKEYRRKNLDRLKVQDATYRTNNRNQILAKKRFYYEVNKNELLQKQKVYRTANRDKINQRVNEYLRTHPEKRKAGSAKYRAAKLQRTPKWLTSKDLNQICNFYESCPEGYHVDHVIPLQGKNVSGLHVLENLQYLPATENLRKSNKW